MTSLKPNSLDFWCIVEDWSQPSESKTHDMNKISVWIMLFPFRSRFVRSIVDSTIRQEKKCSFYQNGSTSRGLLTGLTFYISIIFRLSVLTLRTSSDIILAFCLFAASPLFSFYLPFSFPVSVALARVLRTFVSFNEYRRSAFFDAILFLREEKQRNSRPFDDVIRGRCEHARKF